VNLAGRILFAAACRNFTFHRSFKTGDHAIKNPVAVVRMLFLLLLSTKQHGTTKY